jgi:PAS domain-containing protein
MMQGANDVSAALETSRRHKVIFDSTWTLTIGLATTLAILCGYFGLAQVDIAPVIWTLAGLALAQLALGVPARRASSPERLRRLALASQILGTLLLGIGWHLFGGLQQPLFPLFIILPLIPAALLLGFWQQQLALVALLIVLTSGMLLSPDTNSFLDARYGVRLHGLELLPVWLPHSRVAFADVNTSPGYNLMLVATVAVIAVAATALARSLAGTLKSGGARAEQLEEQLARLERLNAELIARAPTEAALVDPISGRILRASERFVRSFALADPGGQFLLDAVAFHYPTVIKRLLQTGGEEIQGAMLHEREVVLRVRVERLESDGAPVAALAIEIFSELGLRGEIDAVDDPIFTVTATGHVALPNRSAATLLGGEAEGLAAANIFEEERGRWWDIAPLESARRILRRKSRSYLVSIRRERVIASIGELAFVRLQPVTPV